MVPSIDIRGSNEYFKRARYRRPPPFPQTGVDPKSHCSVRLQLNSPRRVTSCDERAHLVGSQASAPDRKPEPCGVTIHCERTAAVRHVDAVRSVAFHELAWWASASGLRHMGSS